MHNPQLFKVSPKISDSAFQFMPKVFRVLPKGFLRKNPGSIISKAPEKKGLFFYCSQ